MLTTLPKPNTYKYATLRLAEVELHTKPLLMDFLSLHKWTLMMFGGGLLTVPVLKDLPPEAGVLGGVLIAIGAWRQVVEVVHARAEERRRQEKHAEMMRLIRKEGLGGVDLEVLKELLGG